MGVSPVEFLPDPPPFLKPDDNDVLEAIDAYVLPLLERAYGAFGYLGVLLAMTIESAAIPVPSELILPLAGFSVARGIPEPLTGQAWSYWGAVIAGVTGNTLGSLIAYAVGAFGGRPLLERYGKYVLISMHDLDAADRHFKRWGDVTVFVSRMLPIVRTFISVPAGIARMPLWRFLLFSILGAIPWVMLLVWGGVVLGEHWTDLKHGLKGLDYLVVASIVAGVGLFIWRHVRKA
ncbi:MAG TPA: DedA family protein [Candidatus Limnocylindria bacterium]|jgi:membrane protein DedA with SNARE-associated domain